MGRTTDGIPPFPGQSGRAPAKGESVLHIISLETRSNGPFAPELIDHNCPSSSPYRAANVELMITERTPDSGKATCDHRAVRNGTGTPSARAAMTDSGIASSYRHSFTGGDPAAGEGVDRDGRREVPFDLRVLHDDGPCARVFTTYALTLGSADDGRPTAAIGLYERQLRRIAHDAVAAGIVDRAEPLRLTIGSIVRRECAHIAARSGGLPGQWKCRVIADRAGIHCLAEPLRERATPAEGVRTITFTGTRPTPGIKSTWTTVSRAARAAAVLAGADEAILVNEEGQLTEGAWSNLLWEDRHGRLCSPAAPHLPGTALGAIVDHCAAAGHPVLFRSVTLPQLLHDTAAIFLTQSTTGLSPVLSIDGHPLRSPETGRCTISRLRTVLESETAVFELGRDHERDGTISA